MKKRYFMSFDEDKFAECKKNLKELGLPPATLSALLNDMLPGISNMLQMQIDKRNAGKQLTLQDMLSHTLTELAEVLRDDETEEQGKKL